MIVEVTLLPLVHAGRRYMPGQRLELPDAVAPAFIARRRVVRVVERQDGGAKPQQTNHHQTKRR